MACHNHGRREQTLEDILTPAQMDELWAKHYSWLERTICEIKLEECRCRCPWPEMGHGRPGYGPCSRCLTLYRFEVKCCDENGPIRPLSTGRELSLVVLATD
jgi:hypothetical protein